MSIVYFVLIGFFVWSLILTFISIWILKFFKSLSSGVEGKSLIMILKKVLESEVKNKNDIKEIFKIVNELSEKETLHIQKLGLVRFNPFRELGGDHSFSLALMDGKDTGVIITGLHTRERTRVYVKNIYKGKSKLDLSSEERKVLQETLKS